MVYRKKEDPIKPKKEKKSTKKLVKKTEEELETEDLGVNSSVVKTDPSERVCRWGLLSGLRSTREWERTVRKFRSAKARLDQSPSERMFRYNGLQYNRFEMMEHIVMMSYEGIELPTILNDPFGDPDNIMPIPREVNQWMKIHPEFAEEMSLALEYRGEIYNNMAVLAVMEAGAGQPGGPTRDQIGYAKLLKDTFAEQAAIASDRFQPKSKQIIEDVTQRQTPGEIQERIAELLKSNPGLIEVVKGYVKGEE